jgi:hypothetical protein
VQTPLQHAPVSQDTIDGSNTSESLPSFPERTGPSVVVATSTSASGTATLSLYPSTRGICKELRVGISSSVSCGTLDPQAVNTGLSRFSSGGDWAHGAAPFLAVQVRIEYEDGTMLHIPTVANAQYGASFFLGEVDHDRVVTRVVAIDQNGTPLAEQAVPPLPKR